LGLYGKNVRKKSLFKSNSNVVNSSKIDNFKRLFSAGDDEEIFCNFDKKLDKEVDDSIIKQEILSIFDRSTKFNSKSSIKTFEVNNLRSSMPPIRSENPFYKNFDLD
jgi:hypothetical protein